MQNLNFSLQANNYLAPRLKGLLYNNPFSIKTEKTHLGEHKKTSYLGAIHLRKMNWPLVSERLVSFIATSIFKYWNEIVPSYIKYMLQLSLSRYNGRSQIAFRITPQKNTGQQA